MGLMCSQCKEWAVKDIHHSTVAGDSKNDPLLEEAGLTSSDYPKSPGHISGYAPVAELSGTSHCLRVCWLKEKIDHHSGKRLDGLKF